jgi:hypothetical protein
MRYLFGVLCVCALGVVPLVGCSETTGDGDCIDLGWDSDCCQAPLSDYCEGSDCPSWDQAVADAEEFGRGGGRCYDWEAYSGPCGDLGYIFIGGLGGTIEYFDAAGALVAVEFYDDVPDFCDETSFNIWFGPIPDCTRDPLNIWENFCKGAGYVYCSSVAECGDISEGECLSRYDTFQCWLRWNNYVECFGDGGTCESCAEEYIPKWEACIEMDGSPE